MRDKSNSQSQIERLMEMSSELEKRELALDQESKQLDQLRSSLDERESKLSAAYAKVDPAIYAAARPEGVKNAPPRNDQPLNVPLQKPASWPEPPAKSQAVSALQPASSTAQTMTEINEILRSIFWDYSNSVHLISSQLSTVTAAMMCAAVTCVLENQGFNAKEVFLEEMEKMLQGGGLGNACPVPLHQPRPAAEGKPAAGPAFAPEAVRARGDGDTAQAYPAPSTAKAQPPQDGVLHILSVEEFEKLGEYGFRNDDSVTRVELPEGVEQLPGSFFYGCRMLEEVWLPNSLREIGPYAFYGCEKLRAVHLSEASQLKEIGEYALAMCSSLQTFAIPAKVETLGTSVFRFCSQLEKLSFVKDGSLRFIGSHLLQNCAALLKLRLPDAITTIPTSMFYGCSALKKVVAKGVDTIEDYAFYGNENLRTVRIRSKKAIAAQAFEGCSSELEIEYLNY